MSDTARLRLEGLGFTYPGASASALRDVSLEVGRGEVVTLVGPSGSGKSTLLRLVVGLLAPQTGTVCIDGGDVTRVAPERRAVAMVFQGYALYPHLTVADNIGFGLRVRRESGRADRVRDVAARLGLEELLDRRPGQLSGGERARVALGRALVRDPAVFCLDEPLASLDAALRVSARRSLARDLRADGRGALVVTHDQAEAMALGDRVAVLRDGRLEQVGTPAEVYAHPATAFVASFIGAPPAALLPAAGPLAAALGLPSASGSVAVRAEDVTLVTTDDDGVPGVVTEVAALGAHAQVSVDALGAALVAVVPTSSAPRMGDAVRLRVDSARVVRFDADGKALG